MGRILAYLTAQGVTLPIAPRTKMADFDRQFDELEAKVKYLESERLNLQAQVGPLQREVDDLKRKEQQRAAAMSNHPAIPPDECCDHCGSARLVRVGSRLAPHFGRALGKKNAVYTCSDCGKETVSSKLI